ncbi:phage replisome organizer N-terminal domain-containing protein [Trichococcus collinsii]|uniref:Phage replisome organizer, putative, N-terminal region n=1 Tax=Trichococcus collinsii TaxID=157076 RepID=A0AB37ZXR8_9LACT|nr:phage replisome organizer N-terminal domain-containing protein [Trichococcus collinsii]CZR03600.1 replication initiation and membrane attachment [Trichococcus collinsii]SEA00489.1 phage replisome organizer, putative, N-terminal region [Trichococcus collinsii]
MSDNKKYYYLKLKADFFDSDAMIVLEGLPDGYKYSNILLKLYLRSLKNEGKLMLTERIPYNAEMLSKVTRHSIGDVERAVKLFDDLGLIEVLENGVMFMSDIQTFIGRSSTEADRKREYRTRIEKEKTILLSDGQETGQKGGQMSDKNPPEIEIEIERELKIEIETEKEKPSGGDVHLLFQQNFGMPTPIIMQDLEFWINDLNEELVIMALKKAAFSGAPYKYAQTMMKTWASKGIKTIADAEAESVGHQKQMQHGRQPKKEVMPDWVDEPRNETETPVAPEVAETIAERISKLKSSGKNVG